MRQLITRIDDHLHERLKRVAKHQGRSVNSLVTETLSKAVDDLDQPETPAELKRRLLKEGRAVVPPQPDHPVDREAAIAATKGWGTIVSEQLERDRDHW